MTVELKSTRSQKIDRINRIAAAAKISNGFINGVMASPPTITVSKTTFSPAFAKTYNLGGGTGQGTSFLTTNTPIRVCGGVPYCLGSGGAVLMAATTYKQGAGYSNNNIGQANLGPNSDRTALATCHAWESDFDGIKCGIKINMIGSNARIYWNDYLIQAADFTDAGDIATRYITLDFTTRVQGRLRIECNVAASLYGLYCGGAETFTAPQDDLVKVAWIGHSVVRGFGLNDGSTLTMQRHDSHPQVCGKLLGWRDVWPLAIESTGVVNSGLSTANLPNNYTDRIAYDLTFATFDVVVVDNSINDANATCTPTFAASFAALLTQIRTLQPNALIICLGVFPGKTGPSTGSNSAVAVENLISAGVTAFADTSTVFVPFSTTTPQAVLYGTTNDVAPGANDNTGVYINGNDGAGNLHPNLAGHLYIAKYNSVAILKALNALVAA